jgi:glycosyltransferase involved in cell wall biosynthesis
MAEPRVSIIIANFNYEHFIAEAVSSALSQTGVPVEVIVVDDGSTDQSLRVLEQFSDRIVLIAQANAGQAGAFNAALDRASSDIVCLLDADDYMYPTRAARVVEAAAANPKAGIFIHPVRKVDVSRRPLGDPWPSALPSGSLATTIDRAGGYWPCPPSSGLAFRTDLLRQLTPIPAAEWRRYGADAYLQGLAPYLADVAVVDEPLSEYRIHDTNIWTVGSGRNSHLSSNLSAKVQSIATRHGLLAAQALRLGIPYRASLRDNYHYQFTKAQLGSATAFLHLGRMAFSKQPFLSRLDTLKGPLSAIGRFAQGHLGAS